MSKISILAISDVHIGCPRLNPYLLHKKFIKYVYPHITPEISILFVCGDFFDTLLNLNAFAAFEAMEIIKELKSLCRKSSVDLRILRGTFTHDRNQPRHFVNGENPDDSSVRLYDTMSVEHHEKTGLNILYMPDNLVSIDVYEDIRNLLEKHNLEKVDILVHHGYFKHMLPQALLVKGLPHGCLEAEKTSKFVKGCVLNGHVHISSIYQNVISIGSFDRMAHGEEEPKGFYRIDIQDGVYSFQFLENKDASKFLTFNLLPFSTEEAIPYFMKKWEALIPSFKENEPVRIRIMSNDKAVIEGCSQAAKSLYEQVSIDQSSVVKRDNLIENIKVDLEELPKITDANLTDLLLPILKKTNPNITAERVQDILTAVGCQPKEEKNASTDTTAKPEGGENTC